jgi:hypothetical protein
VRTTSQLNSPRTGKRDEGFEISVADLGLNASIPIGEDDLVNLPWVYFNCVCGSRRKLDLIFQVRLRSRRW